MGKQGIENWKLVKWVLRYLAGSVFMTLHYGESQDSRNAAKGYVDSDYA